MDDSKSRLPTDAFFRDHLLKEADRARDNADVFGKQASLYEEAGITGIHPSASTLRESERQLREKERELRELAETNS